MDKRRDVGSVHMRVQNVRLVSEAHTHATVMVEYVLWGKVTHRVLLRYPRKIAVLAVHH